MKNMFSKVLLLALVVSSVSSFAVDTVSVVQEGIFRRVFNVLAAGTSAVGSSVRNTVGSVRSHLTLQSARNNKYTITAAVAAVAVAVGLYKNREEVKRSVKENKNTYAAVLATLAAGAGLVYKFGMPSCFVCPAAK
ncbi:MAG: hypothetical protein NTX86_04485 [Candidatus Dependentiae bacterium]|nr:hypothetical protein [Candidatus Dependentiae bacterium]